MNLSKIKGKTAVVTGASSGIGLQFCRRLAEQGADIVMISNQNKELTAAAHELSDKYGIITYPLCVDLTAPDVVTGIETFLQSRKLQPEILINNAGIFSFNYLTETPDGKVEAFIDLHVRAVTQLSIAFARRFKALGRGWILNMSSMSCWMPMPGIALYSSTKAYIRVLSRALHYEMRDDGVRVCVACPGGIATDLFGLPHKLQRLAVRIGALQTPEKFSYNALKRLMSGKAQYINGPLNRFAIFFIAIMPRHVRMLVKRLMLDKGIRKP